MNIKEMTTEQIEEKILFIADEITKIRSRLEEAKANMRNGVYEDPDWFRRATYTLRAKGNDHQWLQRELGKRNREAKWKRANSIERFFLELARQRLDPVTFSDLLDEAIALTDINGLGTHIEEGNKDDQVPC